MAVSPPEEWKRSLLKTNNNGFFLPNDSHDHLDPWPNWEDIFLSPQTEDNDDNPDDT